MRLSAELTFQMRGGVGAGPEPAYAWAAVPGPQMATRAGSRLQASPPRWQPLQSPTRPDTHAGASPNSFS